MKTNEEEHFVVIDEWALENEFGTTVLGVYHSLDKAKEMFDYHVRIEKGYLKENGYTIYEDRETCFIAGEEGFYNQEHRNIYIERVLTK